MPITEDGRQTVDVYGYGIRMGLTLMWAELLHEPEGGKLKPFEITVVGLGEDSDRIEITPNYYQVVD